MKLAVITSSATLLALASTFGAESAFAQPYPYNPQAPAPSPDANPAGSPAAPPPQPGAPLAGYIPPVQQGPVSAEGSAQAASDGSTGVDFGLEGRSLDDGTHPPPSDSELAFRETSLKVRNSLSASSGLLRVQEAGAGAEGTFRVGFFGSWFSGNGFLCTNANRCPTIASEDPATRDEVDRMGAHFALSATILPYLEAYLGLQNSSTSDSRSRPRLLQVLGDTNFGAKAFWPWEPDQIWSVGGQLDLLLLNGTGGVGLDSRGTSVGLRALGTIDLSNQTNPDDQLPFRFHGNFGYLFDNSANVIEDLELAAPPEGRGSRITRVERYGLNINRVDSIQVALGAEYLHSFVRPFLEWSIDVPANRQGYICNVGRAADRGDACLGREAGFETSPSRLGLGVSVYPWEDQGLAATGAFEIATGGSSRFIEEVAPESPWTLYFGLGYAYDTQKPKPVVTKEPVTAPAPLSAPPRYVVSGLVVERGTQNPVPDAIIRYEGRDITGMVSDAGGQFRTVDLEPGNYTFSVSAKGYRNGQCSVSVQPSGGVPGAAPVQPGPYNPSLPPPSFPESAKPSLSGNQLAMPIRVLAQGPTPYPTPTQPGQPGGFGPGPGYGQPGLAPGQQPAGSGYGQPGPGYGQPTVTPPSESAPPLQGQSPLDPSAPGTTPAPLTGQQAPREPIIFPVRCELEALPKVGNVVGVVMDGEAQNPVPRARVKIQDRLGRELELLTDAAGSFRFENVPPGRVVVRVEAPDHMLTVQEFEVRAQQDLDARIAINPRPAQPNVVVTNREIRLQKAVHFENDSAKVSEDSFALLEEIATVMKERPDVKKVEVQGHTDNAGTEAHNLKLSQERAEAVVNALVRLGVDRDRLEARGYGQDKPLMPNTTDANRAKNRRVQLLIKQR